MVFFSIKIFKFQIHIFVEHAIYRFSFTNTRDSNRVQVKVCDQPIFLIVSAPKFRNLTTKHCEKYVLKAVKEIKGFTSLRLNFVNPAIKLRFC